MSDLIPYLGEVRVMGFALAPKYWAPCNGQLLPIAQNEALFGLLGTTYGGDGKTNFALLKVVGPKSQGTPLRVCISLYGQVPQQAW